MATHLDFGFDHYLLTTGALRSLHDRIGIAYNHDDSKTDLIFRLEKFAADCRENQKTMDNCKKYLDNNFSVEKYTKPKLRQVLAQYNVHYGTNPKRSQLVEIFLDQLPYLKRMNGLGEPDAHTENITNGFNSMNVNDPTYQNNAGPVTAPAATTRKAQRGKHVTFDNSNAPTRVQPHRQAKQSASAAANDHRFAQVPGLQDPRTRIANDNLHPGSHTAGTHNPRGGASFNDAYTANNMAAQQQQQQQRTLASGGLPIPGAVQYAQSAPDAQYHVDPSYQQYLAHVKHQQHLANANYQQHLANANHQQHLANASHQQYVANANYQQHTGQYRAPTIEEGEDDDEDDVEALANHLVNIARKGDTVGLKKILSAFQNSQ